MEIRTQFHGDMASLTEELLEEGELAERAVMKAVRAVVTHDAGLAEEVIAEDDAIDERYLRIDQGVLAVIATQSPVASDLRLLSTILHVNLHLERIGDQAVNVAKLHLATGGDPGGQALRDQLEEMGSIVTKMVRTAMEAFARRDLQLALDVPKMDDPVDRLNRATHLEALKLADDPRRLDWGLHMNLAARALERVGDNAVDIVEQVGFLLTGEFREYTDASHPDDADGADGA